jgi:glycosyltransferase involved in cell wall biosynthesis
VLQEHFGVPERKITVIPNGVPAQTFRPDPGARTGDGLEKLGLRSDRFTLLSAGALVAEKGVDLVIKAMSALDHVQLVVAGDGPQREELVTLATSVAANRVAFVGSVDDMAGTYALADAVVLASRAGDSMPAALIEAGMMGLPSVATPVDGIPEIVVSGSTGTLVPIGDVGALRNAIDELANDPEMARRFGSAARDHCDAKFSMRVVAGAWAAVLDQVSGEGRAARE